MLSSWLQNVVSAVNDAVHTTVSDMMRPPPGEVDVLAANWDRARKLMDETGERARAVELIAEHLGEMIASLQREADAAENQPNDVAPTGPCVEFVLQQHVCDALVRCAEDGRPLPAVRGVVLHFLANLLKTVRVQLLPESVVRVPIERLLRDSGRLDKRDGAGAAVLMGWVELCVAVVERVVATPALLPLVFAGPTPARLRAQTAGLGTAADPRFLVVGCLLEALALEDDVGRRARQGLLLVVDLIRHDPSIATYLIQDAFIGPQIAVKLAEQYLALPMFTGSASAIGSASGSTSSTPQRGSNGASRLSTPRSPVSLAGPSETDTGWLWWCYVEYLQFVDGLVGLSPAPELAQDVCAAVQQKLLLPVVCDALLKPAERIATQTTRYLAATLREIRSPQLVRAFEALIVDTVQVELVHRIDGLSEPLAVATLGLWDAVLQHHDPAVVVQLALVPSEPPEPSAWPSLHDVHETINTWLHLASGPEAPPPRTGSLSELIVHPNELQRRLLPELQDELSLPSEDEPSLEEDDRLAAQDQYLGEARSAVEYEVKRLNTWHCAVPPDARADGPLLRALVECVAQMPDIALDKALLASSCLARLAACHWSAALQWALLSSHGPLFQAVAGALQRTRQRCAGITGLAEKLHALRHADALALPPKEHALLLSFLLLTEFCSELAALFIVHIEPKVEALYEAAIQDHEPLQHSVT